MAELACMRREEEEEGMERGGKTIEGGEAHKKREAKCQTEEGISERKERKG